MKKLKVILLAGLLTLGQVFAQSNPGPRWRLVWNENPEPDVINYGIYVANSADGPYSLVGTVPDINGQMQGWDIPPGTYDGKFFRASALNDAGLESDLSANWVRVPVKPSAPTDLQRLRL